MSKPKDIQNKPQEVSEKSKEADKDTLKNTAEVNKDVANKQAITTNEATTEEVKDKQGIGNKYISHQIIAEPIKSVSPESILNAAIAAVQVLGQAIIDPIKEKLGITSELSDNPSAINSNEVQDCIDKVNKKCATISQTTAMSLELANGHLINGAFNNIINAGHAVFTVSDTTISNRTPFYSISTQDLSFQSNNSITNITDFKFDQSKQYIEFIEGNKTSQSQTSLTVATESNENISKYYKTVGVEENSSSGKVNKIVADDSLLALSGNTTNIISYGDMSTQSNGSIAIVASKPNTVADIAASGEELLDTFTDSSTSITIANSNGDDSNIWLSSKQGLFTSTTGSSINTSGGVNVTSGDKGVASVSDKFVYVGGSKGGTFSIGGRTFIGKFSFPITEIENLNFAETITIPPLPTLPKNINKKLENCIPQKYKDKKEEEDKKRKKSIFSEEYSVFNTEDDTDTSFTNKPSIFSEDFNTEDNTDTSFTTDPSISITPPINPNANNPIQLPRESLIAPPYNPSNNYNNKLPPITDNNSVTVISSLTAANIFPVKHNNESKEILSELLYLEGVEYNTLSEVLEDKEYLELASFELQDVNSIFNSDTLGKFVEDFYVNSNKPSINSIDFLSIINYAEFYGKLLEFSPEVLKDFVSKADTLFSDLDQGKVTAILTLINEYPELNEKIVELVESAKLGVAIGFLGNLGGLTKSINFVNKGISVVKDIAKLPNLIKKGNFKDIFAVVKPHITKPLKGTVFGKLLDNADLTNTLLQFGTDITKGNLTKIERDKLLKDTFDKVYNDEIKKVLEKKAKKFLGKKLENAIPLFKNIMCKVKLGCTINPKDYINQFGDILYDLTGEKSFQKSKEIYEGLEQLIKDTSKGDILKILTGGNLEGLLTNIIDDKSAGEISKVFKVIKSATGLYDSLKLLPDLLTLMDFYKVPAIDQIKTALNCLDLFNKAKSLYDSIKGLGNNKNTSSLFESAGRATQLKNTLDSLDDNTLKDISNQLPENIDLVDYKRVLNSNVTLNPCFKLPKLNIFQSAIEVIELKSQSIVFKLTNFDILKDDVYLLPKRNDLVQLRINKFFNLSTKEYLTPYQTDFQYTPSVYSFVVSEYNSITNIGVAFYDRAYSSIVLENEEGILYKFKTEAIGNTLNMDIIDSYLLA